MTSYCVSINMYYSSIFILQNCVYRVKVPDQQTGIIGTIHFQEDLVRIVNTFEKCLAFRRKQGTNCYVVCTLPNRIIPRVQSFLQIYCTLVKFYEDNLCQINCSKKQIKTESGEKLASVEIFRGFRGDIIYYGLSILGDVSSTNKALLIALTVIMV